MATYKSVTKTAQDAGAAKAGSYIADAALISGKVRYLQVDATVRVGGLALGDVVQLAELPAGATIIPALCSVHCLENCGPSSLNIGTAADPDALAAGQGVATAGVAPFESPTVGSLKLTERTTIQMVCVDDTLTAETVFYVLLAYTVGE